ncbi:MAG TPA: hypothetical protein DCX60_02320 [Phycisphaerales bacterium]|nr:hypothetical protein [Phycisphaerales bacterium]
MIIARLIASLLIASSGMAHPPCPSMSVNPEQDTPTTIEPPTATEAYALRRMRGWTVRINPAIAEEDPRLLADTLEELDHQLYGITRVIPSPALEKLREIEIWVELDMPKTACMCYHVSRDWLVPNGYNPDKEGGIEVGNARAFLEWTKTQPWMVLHELAHGYHDQVFGYDDESIIEGWKRMKESGSYERVGHISGTPRRHYALTNQMEWFAETTEAYFGTNDFHPYVRSELMWADPEGYRLMQKVWSPPHPASHDQNEQTPRRHPESSEK